MRAGAVFLVAAALLAARPSSLRANAFDTFGFSPRSMAMGNAFAGVEGDIASIHHNPAGLAGLDGSAFLFSPLWQFASTKVRGGDGSSAAMPASARSEAVERNASLLADAEAPSTSSGTTIGLGLKAGHRFGVGLALYLPGRPDGSHFLDFNVIKYRFFDSYTPFDLQTSRMDRVVILPAAGLRVTDRLDVGLGMSILADATSSFITTIPLDSSREVRMVSDLDIPPTGAPYAGLMLRPLERLAMGLVYREEIKLKVSALADTEVSVGFGSLQFPVWLPLHITAITHFSPRQLDWGASYRIGSELLLAADILFAQWSSYIPPFPEVTGIDPAAFEKVPEGLRPELPFVPPVEVARFKNTLTPRIGAEWKRWAPLALRAGLGFEPSPVPEQTGTSNILDADRVVVSAGGSFRLAPNRILRYPLGIEAFARYTRLSNVTHRKTLDRLRDEDEAQDGTQTTNPGYPSVTYSGWSVLSALSLSLHF